MPGLTGPTTDTPGYADPWLGTQLGPFTGAVPDCLWEGQGSRIECLGLQPCVCVGVLIPSLPQAGKGVRTPPRLKGLPKPPPQEGRGNQASKLVLGHSRPCLLHT